MSRANIWGWQLNLLFLSSHRSIYNIYGSCKGFSKEWDQALRFRLNLHIKVKRSLSPQRQEAFAMLYTQKKNCWVFAWVCIHKNICEYHPENAFFSPISRSSIPWMMLCSKGLRRISLSNVPEMKTVNDSWGNTHSLMQLVENRREKKT